MSDGVKRNGGFFVIEIQTGMIDGFYANLDDAVAASIFWKIERGMDNMVAQSSPDRQSGVPDDRRLNKQYRVISMRVEEVA